MTRIAYNPLPWAITAHGYDLRAVPLLAELGRTLGPDNGHLTRAGADPAAYVARHAERIGALHIKDIHLNALEESRRRGDDVMAATRSHLWAEPGRGDCDLAGLLAAVGDEFEGWIVIEVDSFDLPTPEESVAATGAWVRENLLARARA